MMRPRLRWKILLLTAVPPVALAMATLWLVNRHIAREMEANLLESLLRSSSVFEDMLAARAASLGTAGEVIVRDPRFFSVLSLSVPHDDPGFRATVKGVARDFNRITRADLFEVLGDRNVLLASVGKASSSRSARDSLARAALAGRPASGVLVEGSGHYQATVTPVRADGRIVGALLIGAGLGESLAQQLRRLTNSEVTFVSGAQITGSTFEDKRDREALLESLVRAVSRDGPSAASDISQVHGASQTWITLARPLPGSRANGRQLYVMQRSLDAEEVFLSVIRGRLMKLGVITVLLAVLMGIVIAERITRPVQRLVHGAEEMQRGNYEFPLQITSRDEIGYLAERFDAMRQRERAYVESLHEVARVKSEFISVASHELRTPISIIKGFIDLFVQGSLGPVTPSQKEAMAAVERSVTGLVRIAEDATRMAQIERERLSLSIGDQDVAELVEGGVRKAIAEAPDRDLDVTIEVEPELPPARVDGVRLAQAIENLVRNAIRFTADGGEIRIEARRDGSELMVRVQDTGIGIAEDKRAQVFGRPFMVQDSLHHHSSSTLEFNSSGLGLGLSIARGIVEAHHGRIDVESRLGRGSTFTIRVPYVCEPRSEAA